MKFFPVGTSFFHPARLFPSASPVFLSVFSPGAVFLAESKRIPFHDLWGRGGVTRGEITRSVRRAGRPSGCVGPRSEDFRAGSIIEIKPASFPVFAARPRKRDARGCGLNSPCQFRQMACVYPCFRGTMTSRRCRAGWTQLQVSLLMILFFFCLFVFSLFYFRFVGRRLPLSLVGLVISAMFVLSMFFSPDARAAGRLEARDR